MKSTVSILVLYWLTALQVAGEERIEDPVAKKLRDNGVVVAGGWRTPDQPQATIRGLLLLPKYKGPDEDLKLLADYGPIRRFYARDNAKVTDQTIHCALERGQFREVHVKRCPITDACLQSIAAAMSVESLKIESCRITDEGLQSLSRMKQLQHLSLRRTDVTADGVKALEKKLPGCEILCEVIPNPSRELWYELGHEIANGMSRRGEARTVPAGVWEVKRINAEIKRMRKIDPQFLRVMNETEKLLDDGKLPPDTAARIKRGLKLLDETDNEQSPITKSPIVQWLLKRYHRDCLSHREAELLAHYMDALVRKVNSDDSS